MSEACIASSVRVVFDPPLHPDEFDLGFPVGTRVTETDSKSSIAKRYVVLADGRKESQLMKLIHPMDQ